MNRQTLTSQVFNHSKKLTVRHVEYGNFIEQLALLKLKTDLGRYGDITTNLVFGQENPEITAKIISREDGIVAGIEEISYLLAVPSIKQLLQTRLAITSLGLKKDGQSIKAGEKIMEIKGQVKDILRLERLILNILQRMSGLATSAFSLVKTAKQANKNILLTCTRKTIWDLIDKKAVSLGGAGTHRLNLSQAVLIKDNHLANFDQSIESFLQETVDRLKKTPVPYDFFEIEVESEAQVLRVAKKLKELLELIKKPIVIMFDNFSPTLIKKTLEDLKKTGLYKNFLFEASGGITANNIAEYAKTGVDVISMGALTTRAKNLDMSLDMA